MERTLKSNNHNMLAMDRPLTSSSSIFIFYRLETNILFHHGLLLGRLFTSLSTVKEQHSVRDGNTRPSYPPPEKSVCRTRSRS